MSLAIDGAYLLSNKILDLANETGNKGYDVDYFKMHVLLYYVQGTMLSVYNIPFFVNKILAEKSGPFIGPCSPVYQFLSIDDGLHSFYQMFGIDMVKNKIPYCYHPISLTDNRLKVLDYVAKKYGNIDRDTLIFESKKQLPYIKTIESEKQTISEDLLKQFFETIVDKSFFA